MHRLTRMCAGVAAAASCWLIGSAQADEFGDRFDFHGFGFQNYMQTSDNRYLGVDRRGSWDGNFLGLVMSATINDRSRLWAQLEASTGGGTNFTWFFVDYQLSDNLRAHIGRVKFPVGLYNEIIDAKSLQVSLLEPALYQSDADFVHDAYHGVGFDYEQQIGKGHLLWQIYGGNNYDIDPPPDSKDRHVIGGRLTYRTPLRGLRFMVSANRTVVEELADNAEINEDRLVLSVDFSRYPCDVKSEFATHHFEGISAQTFYVQGRYSFSEQWAGYLRYDEVVLDNERRNDPSFFQKTTVAGIEYKPAANIDIRLENHFNHGYGLPVASGEMTAGAGKTNWNLTVVGVAFNF